MKKSVYVLLFAALAWLAAPAWADGGHLAGSCPHTHNSGLTICDTPGNQACTTKNGKKGNCVQRTRHCQCKPPGKAAEEEEGVPEHEEDPGILALLEPDDNEAPPIIDGN